VTNPLDDSKTPKRIDGPFAVVEDPTFGLVWRILTGDTALASRLKDDLEKLKVDHEDFLTVSWDDLEALNSADQGTQAVKRRRLWVDEGIPRSPIVDEWPDSLADMAGAIAYKDALTDLTKTYDLPDGATHHLYVYLRDGRLWNAPMFGNSGSIVVDLIAVVRQPGQSGSIIRTRENDKRIITIEIGPNSYWYNSVAAINPVGDWSQVDRQLDELGQSLKTKLGEGWRRRVKRREPDVEMYCAYLADRECLPALEIWELVFSSEFEIAPLTDSKKRRVRDYVTAGRLLLG